MKKAKRTKKQQTIAVLGLWHLGLVHTACLAKLGYRIIAIDQDSNLTTDLANGKIGLFEPGLADLLKKHKKTIQFTSDFALVQEADLLIVAYDTPLTDLDDVDLTPLVTGLDRSAKYLSSETPVVVASQVPIGTCDEFFDRISQKNKGWHGGIVYMPENLRLGQALDRFLQPDFLVFGSDDESVAKNVAKFFAKIKTEKRFTSLRNAEMVKHAINFHLATSITYINQLAQIAEALGADAVELSDIIRLDPRIGRAAPLFPGLGFSGGTLARDVRLLTKKAQTLGLNASLLKTVGEINDSTFDRVLRKLSDHLGSLKSKNVTLLGITYKPGTSTLRRSPAIRLAEMLKKSEVNCLAFDPMADSKETDELKHLFIRSKTIEDAVKDSDGIVVVTEWPEFRKVDFSKMAKKMRRKLLIDSKNFLDPVAIKNAGFHYEGFGRFIK